MCLNGSDQTTSRYLATSKTVWKERSPVSVWWNGRGEGTGKLELIVYWERAAVWGKCRVCLWGRKKGTGSQLHRWLSWVGQVTGDERRGVIGHVNDSDGFIWVITWCRPSQPERSWRLLWFWDTPLCHLGGWTEETGRNNKQRIINYEEKQTLQFCVTFSVI